MQSTDGTGGCQADICYGGQFFIRAAELLLHNTGESVYGQPFFEHVTEYLDALHRLHYPAAGVALAARVDQSHVRDHAQRILAHASSVDVLTYLWYDGKPIGDSDSCAVTRYFPDGGHALFRTVTEPALDLLFSCAAPLPHSVLGHAARYEGGHATPNMGQFRVVFAGDSTDDAFLCNA
ncbi:MAG: hypothetical protein GY851_10145, partial [bacterium]|nr:hypothetical protein [bacterium]